MERSGLVQRTKSPDDGRAATVTVTAAGRRRFRKAEALYVAAVEDAFGRHLDPRASRLVKDALEQVLARRAGQLGAGSSVPK
jgi:DNA-binding MarR family transcriptional regulator